jgi:hypothetical protein
MRINAGLRVSAERANYDTSRGGLNRAGLIVAEKGELPPPPFVWIDGILSKEDALEHHPFQRFNKIPGMDYICYKSTLFRALNDARRLFPHLFDIYPKTYLLPREFLEFKREHTTICGKDMAAPFWVVKPRNACCGRGISIVQSIAELQSLERESVAQLYVRPFLIRGHKFDFRFFLLIASLEPLTIFLYREGIARFCTEPFESPSRANRDKKFMHLTNTAINIENSEEPPSSFTKLATEVLQDLEELDERGQVLWNKICDASRSVIIGLFPTILHNLPKKCDQRLPNPPKREGIFSTGGKGSKISAPLIDLPEPPQDSTEPTILTRRGFRQPPTPDVVCRQMNMVIIPGKSPHSTIGPSQSPIVVGSIFHYQIQPAQPRISPIMRQQFLMANRRRSVSVSPDRPIRQLLSPSTARLPPIPDTEEEDKTEEPVEPPPLPLAKRFFHILGIDIIIDSEMNPQVLELNDRPSLGVTVEFEQELKELIIADAFEHVLPNGDVRGDTPETSRWSKIYPLTGEAGATWRAVIAKLMNPFERPNEIPRLPPPQTERSRLEFTQAHKKKRKKSIDKSSG